MQLQNIDKMTPNLICVLGHTAAGKTAFAALLADKLKGEIISADSRQVYRYMDIGTGKDLEDFTVKGKKIPYHLIDIVDPGYEYNVYEFQKDFLSAFHQITSKGNLPILCGGTGMYIEAVLKGYKLINVPKDLVLRERLSQLSHAELVNKLKSYKNLHNITDTGNRKRLTRALEIEDFYSRHPDLNTDYPALRYTLIGIRFDRESRRTRITKRLENRLQSGMIEETKRLMEMGISEDKLVYYGLEYKFLAWYLSGKLTYKEMFEQLNTAIHRYAKRQMTWFRKMEREGFNIHWLDGHLSNEERLEISCKIIQNFKYGEEKA